MIKIDNNIKSTLKFIDYVVDESFYTTNKNFKEEPVQLDIKIGKEISISEKNDELFVILKCEIFEDAVKKNYPFSLSVKITGIFGISEIPEENINNLVNINAVSILFPYVRALISTLTASFNVQPLILPPINVLKLFENDIEEPSK